MMKHTKKYALLCSLAASALLASCGGNGSGPINRDNAIYNLADNRKPAKATSFRTVAIPEGYRLIDAATAASWSLNNDPGNGFVFVQGEAVGESYGVYSILFEKMIVEPLYTSFSLTGGTENGIYIIGISSLTGLRDVYDYRGYSVLKDVGILDPLAIGAHSEGKQLIETYQVGDETAVNKIVNEDGTRTDYVDENEVSLPIVGDVLQAGKTNLKKYGLEGYYAKIGSGYWRVYKDNGDLMAQYQVPSDSADLTKVIFDKTIVYQVKTPVADDSSTYDLLVVEGGLTRKYMLRTYTIEILSGKLIEHSVDYIIDSLSGKGVVYDSEGVMKYGLVNAYDISNKRVMSEYSKLYVLNNDASVSYDASADPAFGAEILTKERYYNSSTKELLDGNFTSIATLGGYSVTSKNYGSELFTVSATTGSTNVLGAINYDGRVVVPFKYAFLDLSVLNNGWGYGKGTDLKNYLINPSSDQAIEIGASPVQTVEPLAGLGAYRLYNGIERNVAYIGYDGEPRAIFANYDELSPGGMRSTFFDSFKIDSYRYLDAGDSFFCISLK